jgi:hypothetical protein
MKSYKFPAACGEEPDACHGKQIRPQSEILSLLIRICNEDVPSGVC